MKTKRFILSFSLGLFFASSFIISFTSFALADGGFFTEYAGTGESSDQKAVIAYVNERETIILQTNYRGNMSKFAWVIPVPTLIEKSDVRVIDESGYRIFEDLYEETEPRAVEFKKGKPPGCGCSPLLEAEKGESETDYAGVSLHKTFLADEYIVNVLSAEDSSSLDKWLNDNGYQFPSSAEDVLDYYISKKWYFLALKIDPSYAGEEWGGNRNQERGLRPVQIGFNSPEIVYPMRISSVSSKSEVEVLLYVISPHRVRSTNYTTVQMDIRKKPEREDFPSYYGKKFRETLKNSGGRALVVEYVDRAPSWFIRNYFSGILDPKETFYLTRLRSYLSPTNMDEDILLAADEKDDSMNIFLSYSSSKRVMGEILLAGLFLTLFTQAAFFPRGGTFQMGCLIALLAAVTLL